MIKRIFFILTILLVAKSTRAIGYDTAASPNAVHRSDNFDNATISSIWNTTAGCSMSLSSAHLKAGTQSLEWTAVPSGKLIASDLNIPPSETNSWSNNATRFYIYNKTAGNDTLIVRFYDNAGIIKRTGRMLLNFSGWRDYFRSHLFDYDTTGNGNYSNQSGFMLNRFELEYKPQTAGSATTIYLDEISFTGMEGRRQPGIHMLADLICFRKAFNVGTELIDTWVLQPAGTAPAATAQEIADLQIIKAKYGSAERSYLTIDAAKQFVTDLGINRNTDGTITASRGYLFPLNVTTNENELLNFSRVVGTLAKRYRETPTDTDAREKLNLFVEYLLDQGVAEGGYIYMNNSAGERPRRFYTGFIDALPYLDAALLQPTLRMLKWAYQYGRLYEGANYKPGYDVDYIQNKTNALFELCFTNPNQNERVRDLKLIRDFLERFTVACPGTRDAFKVDGLAFHHNNVYPGYMYTLNIWIDQVNRLKGTVFRIGKAAYDRMSFIIQTLTIPTSPGSVYYPNSLSARHPFPIEKTSSNPGLYVKYWNIETLISVGADIIGQSVEPDLAATYNYFFPAHNKYPGIAAKNFNYYHQYNYGQLGIVRTGKWVAAMKGFTNKFWGTETYATDNRLGRYQCYGALEFLYGETLRQSGYLYLGNGWDWNVMPGTTTTHLSWNNLKTIGDYVDEFQKKSFSGALAIGNNGIWAMEFEQRPNSNSYTTGDLKFKKSVFTFDSIFVCLGTGISTTVSLGKTVTNLFQNAYLTTDVLPAVYINSTTAQTANIITDISTTSAGAWLVNSAGTGYYVPRGNGNIHLERGAQSSPKEDGVNLNDLVAANATKAWIDHGTGPANQRYQFIAVPGVTASQMQALSTHFEAGTRYKIEKQTDSLHAVTYIPLSLTSYAFFTGAQHVGIGYVKSITGPALLGVKKEQDRKITLSINNPDLNTTAESYDFITRPHNITLVLKGRWTGTNADGVSIISSTGDSTSILVTVKDGFSKTVLLDSAVVTGLNDPIPPDSMNTAESPLEVRVYPNPSTGNFKVELRSTGYENITMKVTDAAGRLIENRQHIPVHLPFTIGEKYSPGIYYIRVVQGSHNKTISVIKK